MAAVIFGSLLILGFVSYQQVFLVDKGVGTQFYFEGALNQQSEIVDQAVAEDYSSENIRNELYSFNSFLNSRSSSKDIEYSAFQLAVLPEKETALLVNYREEETSYSFYDGSWTNSSMESMQYEELDIPEDREKFMFEAEELEISERFNASKPMLLGHMEMNTEFETWKNYILR